MGEAGREDLKEKVENAVESAEETAEKTITKKLARFGFITKGILFIIIGVLAVLVAIGFNESGDLTGAKGALTTIAQVPYGKVLLIVFIAGTGAYGGWNVLRGIADVDDNGVDKLGLAKRLAAAGIGVFYLLIGLFAIYILFTANKSGNPNDTDMPETLTAILLDFPFGVIIVSLIGLGFLVAALVFLYKAFSFSFLEKFKTSGGEENYRHKLIATTGIAGLLARSVLFILIGYFLVSAAVNYEPNKVVGIDGALRALAEQTFGQIILFFIAFGLICYGFLSILKSLFRDLE